jgi:hypothetical protein
MNDSVDLRLLLKNWPYDPDNDSRIVRGQDGREILQVRTPLGLEQYEMEGRPDGERPHEMETALEHYEKKYREAVEKGVGGDFDLDAREAAELFNEGTLFYFRYVRLFQLRDWRRTIRDTARNLRAFDFVHEHARREEDQQFLEKWRPYVIRINATAFAMLELDKNAYAEALKHVTAAISAIEALPGLEDETFAFERDRSLAALGELAGQIRQSRPVSEEEKLERQLRRAIERQEFERAASLRDRIRELKNQQTC